MRGGPKNSGLSEGDGGQINRKGKNKETKM